MKLTKTSYYSDRYLYSFSIDRYSENETIYSSDIFNANVLLKLHRMLGDSMYIQSTKYGYVTTEENRKKLSVHSDACIGIYELLRRMSAEK